MIYSVHITLSSNVLKKSGALSAYVVLIRRIFNQDNVRSFPFFFNDWSGIRSALKKRLNWTSIFPKLQIGGRRILKTCFKHDLFNTLRTCKILPLVVTKNTYITNAQDGPSILTLKQIKIHKPGRRKLLTGYLNKSEHITLLSRVNWDYSVKSIPGVLPRQLFVCQYWREIIFEVQKLLMRK